METQDWVIVLLTLALTGATLHYARTVASQRADALLPLLHWQEPHVAIAADWKRLIARVQVHLVLWNVGPGAARVRSREARSGALQWTFSHFDEPSIVPSREQLIVQLFLDVPATSSSQGLSVTADVPRDLTVRVVFEDVVERTNYESRPELHIRLPATLPAHVDVPVSPAEPVRGKPGDMLGTTLLVVGFEPDSRSPSQRRIPREPRASRVAQAKRVSRVAALLVLVLVGDWYLRNLEMDALVTAVQKNEKTLIGTEVLSARRTDQASARAMAHDAARAIADTGDEVRLTLIAPWHFLEAEARSSYLEHSGAWVKWMRTAADGGDLTQDSVDIGTTFVVAKRRFEQAIPLVSLYNVRERVADVFDD